MFSTAADSHTFKLPAL
jgi:pyruvate dehydrogenase E1 component alpha subunit